MNSMQNTVTHSSILNFFLYALINMGVVQKIFKKYLGIIQAKKLSISISWWKFLRDCNMIHMDLYMGKIYKRI